MGGAKEFPHLEELAKRAEGDDESIDMQRLQLGSEIDFEGFQRLLRREDDQLRALPATAQMGKQEAEYLAASFMAAAGDKEKLKQTPDKFQYAHKGSLAYVGADAAVLDIPGMGVVQGIAAGFIWKGFETFSQFSIRNQILVLSDLVRPRCSVGTPAPYSAASDRDGGKGISLALIPVEPTLLAKVLAR